jgi:D-alanine-D-alanine ligase
MKIGVIMGGNSSERDISLLTGKEMIENLDKNKYEVIKIEINSRKDLIEKVQNEKIDFALLALHGKFGEDGGAQAILEGLNVPYSGSGMASSSLCMDKDITKRLMSTEGINTPRWITIKKHQEIDYNLLVEIGYPVVVKPVSGGSSIGTFIVKNSEQVMDAVLGAFDYDDEIMIEKYINGTEITCCILAGRMLPIVSVKPNSEFFDYKSKYADNGSEESIIVLAPELQNKVEGFCNKCWNLFKCQVYARIDIIIKDNEPFVLEINTLPGMTKNSLFPKVARTINMDFSEFLDEIIELSFKIKR